VELASRAVIEAYEQTGNISEMAMVFRTTRKTVGKVVRAVGGRRRGWAEASLSEAKALTSENFSGGASSDHSREEEDYLWPRPGCQDIS